MVRLLALSILALLVPSNAAPTTQPDVAYWFTQRIDHFGRNNELWEQHYMVNATYYKSGGPIFITTPGDNTLTSYHTSQTHLTRLAQEHNGLAVAIEQRYYGRSTPFPDLSAKSLEFMTADNMLEDIAAFIRVAKDSPSSVFPVEVEPHAQVVFAGSSFAANVAVWMRARYPDLVVGAWASSAFVNNHLENYHLEQSFGHQLNEIGCGAQFSQAVRELDDILLSGDQARIAKAQELFGLPPVSPVGFASIVSDLAMSETNDPVTVDGNPGVEAVCAHFDKDTPVLVSYANVAKAAIKKYEYSAVKLMSMGNYNRTERPTTLNQPYRVNNYISCTWFSNWMTAAPKNSGLDPYVSQLLNVDLYLEQCQMTFGEGDYVSNVDEFNKKWFYPLHTATNIFYTVGSVDIWRGNSVAPVTGNVINTNGGSHIEVIEGAAHAQDYDMEAVTDILGVKRARHIGNKLVNKWLKRRHMRFEQLEQVE
ncbi:hypothetical protein FBU31_001841 [Coemansia sp. 'formosensis']|nr:hypothetical protein FBU31_001841 [Coemansia sp. 'formosensis']